ncbi:MAG: MBOAT family O-acyltransferase [Gammaproteobacteria bacterium]|nr:MBOAT family O-acyltransferase [Gammaproteobacteria bacterium]
MLFHSLPFFIFFSFFLLCYLPVRRRGNARLGLAVIVAFSAIFYAWWDWRFLLLMWVSVVGDYLLGLLIGNSTNPVMRKRFLIASLVFNLGVLGFFKYWNFFIDNFALILGPELSNVRIASLILPLGISFYTFQSMSYTLDVYRDKIKPINDLLGYAAFVTYFPHMISGPIQKFDVLYPQLVKPLPLRAEQIATGAFLFAFGMFQKSVADIFAQFHDPIFNNLSKAEPALVLTAVFSFGIQIFCDFAGYSLMAIGLARIIGVDLLQNFRAPYLSTSIRDFWRRWHISLSTWLRDYLYISLGGNRVKKYRQLLNLLITFTICGLWHGAGWGFLIWGFLHGLYLCINTLWNRSSLGNLNVPSWISFVLKIPSWVFTFVAANYAWVYFRCSSIEQAMIVNHKLATWIVHPIMPPLFSGILWVLLIPIVCSDIIIARRGDLTNPQSPLTKVRALYLGLGTTLFFMLAFLLMVGQPTQHFIYFTF